VVFIDTYFLFPETLDFLKEVEAHYGFKAKLFHCVDCASQEEFFDKYGADYWMVRPSVRPPIRPPVRPSVVSERSFAPASGSMILRPSVRPSYRNDLPPAALLTLRR